MRASGPAASSARCCAALRRPRTATRTRGGRAGCSPVRWRAVRRGDRLLVGPGEVVPAGGTVLSLGAVLDESALTGEATPVERGRGDPVRSGAVNAGAPFDLLASGTAAESTYAGIVRLVEQAQRSKAPFVRLADRYALAFVPLTLAAAGAAWALSGSAVRALAVLVVATPCPLILAVPVAIVAGISRAARRGVIVKSGAVLERLARTRVLLIDKTGTLTAGQPVVAEVETAGGDADELLRLAACLDQVSPHVLAAAIVRAATGRGLALCLPVEVCEEPGWGIRGRVDGHQVALGKAAWVPGERPRPPRLSTSLSPWIGSTGSPKRSASLRAPAASPCRASWPAWGYRCWRWGRLLPGCWRRLPARSCRR